MHHKKETCAWGALARRLGVALMILMAATARGQTPSPKTRVYVGTYTGAESQGIYLLEMDPSTGQLDERGLAAESVHPSFLAAHPNGRYLYAVNETAAFEGAPGGSISAFAIEADTGRLRFLNRVSSGGAAPCHLVMDRLGRHVLAANYAGGSVVVLAIEEDGRLGMRTALIQHQGSSVNPRRQEAPHAHCVQLDQGNHYALAADLGTDTVYVYRYNALEGTLEEQNPPGLRVDAGSGPRHISFHPSGRLAYVIHEISSTVTVCGYDGEKGVLERRQTISTLPADFQGQNSTADIHAHPEGRYVYGSNRGHNSLAVYETDPREGTLRLIQHMPTQGKTPRNFGIDPAGKFLLAANQSSGNIVVFRIDSETGLLAPTGTQAKVPSPVCVRFLKP